MNFHTLVINKSYSTKKLQGMNKHSQIIDEHMNLTHEITSQIEIFKSMSNDGVKGVIWLFSMHQDVKKGIGSGMCVGVGMGGKRE